MSHQIATLIARDQDDGHGLSARFVAAALVVHDSITEVNKTLPKNGVFDASFLDLRATTARAGRVDHVLVGESPDELFEALFVH